MTIGTNDDIATPATGITCASLDSVGLEHVMEDPSFTRELYPTGMVVIGREPFIIHPINLKEMHKEYSAVQSSFTCKENPSRVTGMSFGVGIRGSGQYTYDCGMYCNSKDPQEFAQHVHTHTRRRKY